MKYSWLAQSERKRLLLFCNGWGMDETPFLKLATTGMDVLVLSDFRAIDRQDGAAILASIRKTGQYDEIVLLAWSMGVWAAHQLFTGHENRFHRRIAVNGTLCPISDNYGIVKKLFTATAENWSKTSRFKFYRRMCADKYVLAEFLNNQPTRTLVDQQQELNWYLEHVGCHVAARDFFTEIWVSADDRIMTTENQLNFWGSTVHLLQGGHFPFYQAGSWCQLVELGNT